LWMCAREAAAMVGADNQAAERARASIRQEGMFALETGVFA